MAKKHRKQKQLTTHNAYLHATNINDDFQNVPPELIYSHMLLIRTHHSDKYGMRNPQIKFQCQLYNKKICTDRDQTITKHKHIF